ncbi:MAG TPA: BON domain-containing protein [Thiobacillus sp.]
MHAHRNATPDLVAVLLAGACLYGMPALAADEAAKTKSPGAKVGELIDDAWITTKIKTLLLKEDLLSALKIDVDTKDGMVRLSGQVDKAEQVARAVDIASNVEGVKSVQMDLLLKKK